MGLHALRNIGFYFKNQTAMCHSWRTKFTDFDPSRTANILHLPVSGRMVEVTYFGCRYRLNCANGVVEKYVGEEWTDDLFVNEALIIYHLFNDLKDCPFLSGTWCPEETLDPVQIRSGNRMDPLLKQFADIFDRNKEEICEKALSIGGKRIRQGDVGFEFQPFDFMPVRTVFWEKDEEFPAQMKVFVDSHAADYLDYEAVDFVIADLLTHLQPDFGKK